MRFYEYKYLILSDLYRRTDKINMSILLRHIFLGEGYSYTFWMRTCSYLKHHIPLKWIIYPIARCILHRLTYRLGISIPYSTNIGSGFYIGHFGGIVINQKSTIGNNCNISQCVTIGQANRGRNKGYPKIGDNVYIGPGAKVIGAVTIGNNVAIGANCVVTKDIPDNSVVVGVPGRVISQKGSAEYVIRTDYDDKIS